MEKLRLSNIEEYPFGLFSIQCKLFDNDNWYAPKGKDTMYTYPCGVVLEELIEPRESRVGFVDNIPVIMYWAPNSPWISIKVPEEGCKQVVLEGTILPALYAINSYEKQRTDGKRFDYVATDSDDTTIEICQREVLYVDNDASEQDVRKKLPF